MTVSADVQVGDGRGSRESKDRVVGEAGHAPGSHQQGGRDESECRVNDRALDHLPALDQVAEEDGEADDAHAGEDTTPYDLCINLKTLPEYQNA